MNKQEKAQVISFLQEGFQKNQASFLVNFKGLSVKEMQSLRKVLRQGGGSFKVAKARLMKRATEGIEGIDSLKGMFKDQVGLVFARQDTPGIAKALYDFSKEHEALQLVAGYFENQVFDKNSVVRIAQLPSKEVLLGQLCGGLNAPISNFVGVLNGLLVKLVLVMKSIEEQKAKNG